VLSSGLRGWSSPWLKGARRKEWKDWQVATRP